VVATDGHSEAEAVAAYVEHAGLARFFAVQWSFFAGKASADTPKE
jgi:hypothetical protein